jgi:hypothetical protein
MRRVSRGRGYWQVAAILRGCGQKAQPSAESSLAAQFFAHDIGTLDHRLHFSEGNCVRQVFHAAVGRDDETLRLDVRQRPADAVSDDLRRLDSLVAEINDPKDDGL